MICLFEFAGFGSVFFLSKIKKQELVPEKQSHRLDLKQSDWGLIIRALLPKMVIAAGAGLTIQFMNLFFLPRFGIDFNVFSLMGIGMTVLVASAVLVVPAIKRKSGYPGAILMTQSAAIVALIMLATTEYY
ncbi:MAG: hypothetical protein BRD49_05785, partial [Bacteroidetes bacterium SW_10_40_5]